MFPKILHPSWHSSSRTTSPSYPRPLLPTRRLWPNLTFLNLNVLPGIAQLQPVESAPVYGIELACDAKFLDGLTLQIKDTTQWQSYQTDASIKPAVFEEDKITQAQAELIVKEPNQQAEAAAAGEETKTAPVSTPKQTIQKSIAEVRALAPNKSKRSLPIGNMFKPTEGYKLVSLKCNKPATGAQLKGEQLPVLLELSGLTHCPAGVIAAGKVDDQTVYEVDYCSMAIVEDANTTTGCLTLAQKRFCRKTLP